MAKSRIKFPHVSFYRNGDTGRWELAYRLHGKRRIERLGAVEAHARQRAQEVSSLLDRHKSNLLTQAELTKLVKDRVPLAKHLEKYEASLRSNRRDPQYVATTVARLKRMIELLGVTRLDHLTRAVLDQAAGKLAGVNGLRGQKLSNETINQHLRAMSQFLGWCKDQHLVAENPMAGVERMNAEQDKRHARRVPTAEELTILFAWLDRAKRHSATSTDPKDRAMYYRLLYATGLRAGELRELRAEWIHFNEPARIEVPAEFTKNGKAAVQPLPAWVVDILPGWIAGRRGKLFPNFSDMKHTFPRDLRRAREAWIDEAKAEPATHKTRRESTTLERRVGDKVLDLHSFRHAYVTALVAGGATVKDAQTLARHSSAELTIGTYAHASKSLLNVVNAVIKKV